MIAGQRLFRGKSQIDTMHGIIHDPRPTLTYRPPELNEILDKALAKDPKDRYQHAGDMALDLRRLRVAWHAKTLPSMGPSMGTVAGADAAAGAPLLTRTPPPFPPLTPARATPPP